VNQRPTLLKPVGPESLAGEGDFQLGDILVRPSLLEFRAGETVETLEPRVMQVLVVLAGANGAVVSRDDLIMQCWGGRIVGEAAINRCIWRIRQLADLSGGNVFRIETIPRVGYRLEQCGQTAGTTLPPAAGPMVAPARPWRWTAAAIAAVAIVASLAVVLYLSLRHEPEWIVAESRLPFISTPLIERYPAIAPDGAMIAYSAGPSINNRHIFLRLLKGGDPIQLTHDEYDASAPAWSPDSSTIAYAIFQVGHPCRIMEIPVPAGQSHQVGQCRVSTRSSLAFDPSGRTLYFNDAPAPGAPVRILKLDLDNGRVSAVTHPGNVANGDNSPSISPDGNALLYKREYGGARNQVRLLSLSDGSDRLIAAFGTDDEANAAWSADAHTIFISRSTSSDNSLWAYPVRGGEPWRILSGGEHIGRLSAGPDGLLAMEIGYPSGQLVALTPHSDLPPKPIENGGLTTWCVDYASDGTFLATGWRSGAFGMWISGTNGAIRELFPLPDDMACAIRWSPDGTRFAYVHRRKAGFDVPVMTRGGEPIAHLYFSARESGLLDWTSDGKSILTSRQETPGWRIWRTDLATPDKSVPITPYGWLSPRVHGTMLFAEKDGVAGIWRIDGTPRRVTDGPAPEASDVFAIAGDRLIYSDTSDPDDPVFSAQNVNGGPKDRLAPLPGGQINFVFGVDPKSGAIVYTREIFDTNIGLLRLVTR
jgi:Tol biopolymer transport system component/DNA-binding winged helix-turn-helix (wHTH) protein